ncbi:DUF7134 domain-containing protein [Frankia tisae]|uniref:DUF7134 domain-containing protein n=1 Tax=Frankia tisae TaxID=2950104 RepID=UPI0021BFEF4B|nr:hypothetical protein [Frankia tisae]
MPENPLRHGRVGRFPRAHPKLVDGGLAAALGLLSWAALLNTLAITAGARLLAVIALGLLPLIWRRQLPAAVVVMAASIVLASVAWHHENRASILADLVVLGLVAVTAGVTDAWAGSPSGSGTCWMRRRRAFQRRDRGPAGVRAVARWPSVGTTATSSRFFRAR